MQQEMKFAAIASESQQDCSASHGNSAHHKQWQLMMLVYCFCIVVADEMLKRKLAESVNISCAPARSCNKPEIS
jgi:hypothetical protein